MLNTLILASLLSSPAQADEEKARRLSIDFTGLVWDVFLVRGIPGMLEVALSLMACLEKRLCGLQLDALLPLLVSPPPVLLDCPYLRPEERNPDNVFWSQTVLVRRRRALASPKKTPKRDGGRSNWL